GERRADLTRRVFARDQEHSQNADRKLCQMPSAEARIDRVEGRLVPRAHLVPVGHLDGGDEHSQAGHRHDGDEQRPARRAQRTQLRPLRAHDAPEGDTDLGGEGRGAHRDAPTEAPLAVGAAMYSTESTVSRMKASSREACSGASSWSTIWFAAASSPTVSQEMPWSVSADASPSRSSLTVTPSSPSAIERSRTMSGVRTRTASPEARCTNSSTVVSAIRRPRPTTISQSAIMLISLMRCEETRIVRPSSASERSRLRIQRMP